MNNFRLIFSLFFHNFAVGKLEELANGHYNN